MQASGSVGEPVGVGPGLLPSRFRENGIILWGVIVSLFAAALLLVPPVGEFPFVDDWDYAVTAKRLAETGNLRLTDWPAMTLVGHVAWGALFVKLFGFSYSTLRISVLFLALAGALALVRCCRQSGQSAEQSLFAGIWWLFCPLVWTYSYTFMTDVSAVSLIAIWVALLPTNVSDASPLRLSLLGVFAAVSYLTRQTAAVPAIVLLTLLLIDFLRGRTASGSVMVVALPLLMAIGGHSVWLNVWNGLPYNSQMSILDWSILIQPVELLNRLANLLIRSGFYLSPLAAAMLPSIAPLRPLRRHRLALGVFFLALLGSLLSGREVLPVGAVVFDAGLDPDMSISGREALRGPNLSWNGRRVGALGVLTTLLAAGSLGVGAEVCRHAASRFLAGRRTFREWRVWTDSTTRAAVIVGSLVASVGLLILVKGSHDRYLLPVLILVALATAQSKVASSRWRVPAAAWLLLATMGTVSIVGVQDCLVRTRAVWQAIDELHRRGVSVWDINGGFAYGGVYRFSPRYYSSEGDGPYLASLPRSERELHIGQFGPATYLSAKRSHTVSYSPLPGHTVVATFPYRSWLREGAVYVMQREASEGK